MALVKMEERKFEGKIKNLVIGDNYYIESYINAPNRSEKARYRKLIYTRTDKVVSDIIVTAYDDTEVGSALVVIHTIEKGATPLMEFSAENDNIAYRAPEGKNLKEKKLGCDTASFEVNSFSISTGSDGYYGVVFEHPTQKESIIHLFVSTDVVNRDDFFRIIFAALPESIV